MHLHAEDILARGSVPGCALIAYFMVSTPCPAAMAAGSATGICRGVMSNAVMSSSPPILKKFVKNIKSKYSKISRINSNTDIYR